ncbi:hypothetical protein [Paraburkholderia sediminicola]|uniref:hypothetical protein n=1 Tax=Paraburkholderia sediminicola TaxID=458836 RepID=UPI0038B7B73F
MDAMLQSLLELRKALDGPEFRARFKASPLVCLQEMHFPVSSRESLIISLDTPSGIPFVAVDKRCFSGPAESVDGTVQNGGVNDCHFTDCLAR